MSEVEEKLNYREKRKNYDDRPREKGQSSKVVYVQKDKTDEVAQEEPRD